MAVGLFLKEKQSAGLYNPTTFVTFAAMKRKIIAFGDYYMDFM